VGPWKLLATVIFTLFLLPSKIIFVAWTRGREGWVKNVAVSKAVIFSRKIMNTAGIRNFLRKFRARGKVC